MRDYPTIHHLICELIYNPNKHDVRLVYLACAWLVTHRGHFLSNINTENIADLVDIHNVYNGFMRFFEENEIICDWREVNVEELGRVLAANIGINEKYRNLSTVLFATRKPDKKSK